MERTREARVFICIRSGSNEGGFVMKPEGSKSIQRIGNGAGLSSVPGETV
jgi:hypothetical protein